MEGRKIKHYYLKQTLHYILVIAVIALAILAYVYKTDIEDYFKDDVTKYDSLNRILKYVPEVIKSIQVIILAVVINVILNILLKIGFGLTDKTKTILNLINSLLKWIVIIAAIIIVLYIWGVNAKVLLVGAGIVALVIGLGAQSLIADILAGIFIVLEGKYVVGDIVVIEGWRGKIVSIGIRTTELQDIGGNIKIINNSEIRSVINQTKLKSMALCSINVASSEKLEDVENVIKEAFPEIRKNIPAITNDIIYKGINNITDITYELLFSAECFEEDLYQVQRDLYRELKLLLDKNNISSFAPPTYVIDDLNKR